MAANDIHAYLFTRRLAELLEIDEGALLDAMRAALYERGLSVAVFKPDEVSVDLSRGNGSPKNANFQEAARRLGRLTQ